MVMNSERFLALGLITSSIIFTAFHLIPIIQMILSRLLSDGGFEGDQVLLHLKAFNTSIRIESLPLRSQTLNTTATIRSLLHAIPVPDTHNVTWVTALYDIGRHDRSFYEYKTWFIETLKIPLPVIVFCKGVDAKWISNARGDHGETLIIGESHIPLENIVDTVKEIISIVGVGRSSVEWVNERYIPTQFSKAVWMQRAMELNPFHSDIFFWVDAGISRFFTGGQPEAPFALLQSTNLDVDRLYISGTTHLQLLDTMPLNSIVGSQLSFVMGGVFGGHAAAVKRASSALLDVLYLEMLGKRRIDNEQVAFGLVYSAHKDWFHILDHDALGCVIVCM
jgi:hypothetical protein